MRSSGYRACLPAAVLLLAACGLGPADDAVKQESLIEASQPLTSQPEAKSQLQATPSNISDTHNLSLEPTECREVLKLLHVQRFTLTEPHEYHWMKGHPAITAGTLLVIEVDPECARPRQVAMPVLYVGEVPAEIAKVSHPSGRLVLVVPGHIDLTRTPIFYGAPELPERVDRQRGAKELDAAQSAGIQPFSSAAVTAAQGGSGLKMTGTTELYQAVSDIDANYAGKP